MTKILNLDALTEEKRTITLNGETHEVVGMSVEGFIKMQGVVEQYADKESTADKLKATVDMIVAAVPTLSKDVLARMSIEKLGMIASFINGSDPDDAAQPEGDSGKK